jgi:hypothetical protein
MRRAVVASVSVLALVLGAGQNAPAARRHAAPVPSSSPLVAVVGEGASLPGGADGDRNGLFGYVSNRVRGGVRIGFCSEPADDALAALLGDAHSDGACASSPQPPDFVAADVPLRSVARLALGARGEPVQVPFLAHAVAIVYDNPDVRGRLRLSIASLCGIASGRLSDWSRIPIDPANPSGLTYPARPLRMVVRTDANGETFALSNFLSSVDAAGQRLACPRIHERFALGTVFDPANTTAVPAPRFGVLPIRSVGLREPFLGARGDGGEISCVIGTPGACSSAGRSRATTGGAGTIGYADTADASAFARAPVGIATLYVVRDGIPRDEDPVADLPGVATRLEGVVLDRGLAPFVSGARPNPELVPFAGPAARAGCVAVVPPSAYAFPGVGYPIVGITNLVFASAGNGARTNALRVLAAVANESANETPKRIRSIDPDGASTGTTGYSVLPLSTKKKTGIPAVVRCIVR